MRKRKSKRQDARVKERVDEILISELEIEHDEDLQPSTHLSSFPGYDEEWTAPYLVAQLEIEFEIDLPEDIGEELRTIQDVYNAVTDRLRS